MSRIEAPTRHVGLPSLHSPVALRLVPMAEGLLGKKQTHALVLSPGSNHTFSNAFSSFSARSRPERGRRTYTWATSAPRRRPVLARSNSTTTSVPSLLESERAVGERRIGESVAETEQGVDAPRVVVACSRPSILRRSAAFVRPPDVEGKSGRVLQAHRERRRSRPEASTSPKRTSAMAVPPSWPGYHDLTIPSTSSAQGISTRRPAVHDHASARIGRRHRVDQCILLTRQPQRGPISFRFPNALSVP